MVDAVSRELEPFFILRSSCPGDSQSYEWPYTAQEVRAVHLPALQRSCSRRNPVMAFGYALMKGMSRSTCVNPDPHTRSA